MSTILQKYFRAAAAGSAASARRGRRVHPALGARKFFRAKTKSRFSPG
jgi:hypothetical protein